MSRDDKPKWIFYRDREDWKDVTPVPQNDGETPVVAIAYSEKFRDVHDYFRAVLQSGEKSERALQLTLDAVGLNAANYTVWQYRRDILKELKKDLHEELDFIHDVILDNPKNYQVWNHRRAIVEWLSDPSNELDFTAEVLKMDAKNYHAWQHRQWAMKTYNLFDNELDYVDSLLTEDLRNNSAWNQRYFVISNHANFAEIQNSEINYTLEKIMLVKENESAWNYLRGLIIHGNETISKNRLVTDFCENLYSSGCRSPFLLAVMVDMCDEQCSSGPTSGDAPYTLKRAEELCTALVNEHDPIRAKYWLHLLEKIREKAASAGEKA